MKPTEGAVRNQSKIRDPKSRIRILPPGELFILTGPTAVGKTELALAWAERFGAEIVSCDALLFYRGMDIGTAKPTAEQRARVPHHLIDVSAPDEPWSVVRYAKEAAKVVEEIWQRGRRVLVTGGSGFYLKSFFEPVSDEIEIPDHVRRQVDELNATGLDSMVEELLRLDPAAGASIDLKNPRRVRRALERCLTTGRSIQNLATDMRSRPFPFARARRHVCLLSRDRDDLADRIARRVDSMLAGGLLDEVQRLREAGIEKNPSAAAAIGYRETLRFLAEGGDRGDLREAIVRNTQRLVKKQMTWFRHQLPVSRSVNLTGRDRIEPWEFFSGL